MRAMILAAGFGTRLRPLTHTFPKALIPVANRPLISYNLNLLRQAGVRQVMINLHHHGDLIRSALGDGSDLGMTFSYSHEREILGTGGGLVRQKKFFKDEDKAFLMLNADILSQVDLQSVYDFHRAHRAHATMVVRPMPQKAGFTPLQKDEDGNLVFFKGISRPSCGAVKDCMFCGIHVLDPLIFDHLPQRGFSCINDQGYVSMMKAGFRVCAFEYEGPWFDLGTPSRYLDAHRALLSGLTDLFQDKGCSVLISPGVCVDPTARLGPNVSVGPRCTIASGVRLSNAILWPGTFVPQGARWDSVIASGDVVVKG
jgi:NDP-sugar pyrophosphorylase family protein